MAELTIRLEIDPVTGKKNIVVDLKSDADALPVEHEEQHKNLVNKLFNGKVKAERESGGGVVVNPNGANQERQAETNKS